MNHREKIGHRLSAIRRDKGMTIRELAEKSGVNYANICKIENGRYNVGIDILTKLADALYATINIVEK